MAGAGGGTVGFYLSGGKIEIDAVEAASGNMTQRQFQGPVLYLPQSPQKVIGMDLLSDLGVNVIIKLSPPPPEARIEA